MEYSKLGSSFLADFLLPEAGDTFRSETGVEEGDNEVLVVPVSALAFFALEVRRPLALPLVPPSSISCTSVASRLPLFVPRTVFLEVSGVEGSTTVGSSTLSTVSSCGATRTCGITTSGEIGMVVVPLPPDCREALRLVPLGFFPPISLACGVSSDEEGVLWLLLTLGDTGWLSVWGAIGGSVVMGELAEGGAFKDTIGTSFTLGNEEASEVKGVEKGDEMGAAVFGDDGRAGADVTTGAALPIETGKGVVTETEVVIAPAVGVVRTVITVESACGSTTGRLVDSLS